MGIKMQKNKRMILKYMVLAVFTCIVAGGMIVLLLYYGVLQLNHPSQTQYPVRGVDVASYQGDIDWEVLSRQEIDFAYIKATEGSTFTDRYFQTNFADALKTNLRVGAYHFFSFDSPGVTQAAHYVEVVPKVEGVLPPVVDFEFYGDKKNHPPDPEETREQLDILLHELEDYYGMKPVLYATEDAYHMYLSGYYRTYDIWIRNIFTRPGLPDGQNWTFWQYTNREHLDGYRGTEYYIDMNVFNGTEEEFAQYGRS